MIMNFKTCLDTNAIYIAQGIERACQREIDMGRADLASAKESFEAGEFKWSTVQSYYAMLYAGRALLYSEGYNARDEFALFVALKSLFLEKGRLAELSLNHLVKARDLREAADTHLRYSRETAEVLLEWADDFIEKAISILGT